MRLSVRALLKTPGISSLAVIALAVGMTLATIAFVVAHQLLNAVIPVPGGERLMMVREFDRRGGVSLYPTGVEFLRQREAATSFEDMGAWYHETGTLEGQDGSTEVLEIVHLTENAFPWVGGLAHLGRTPGRDHPVGGEEPLLLSWRTWQHRFGGDPDIVGRIVRVGGRSHTVSAVMQEGFGFPHRQDAWIPLRLADLKQYDRGRKRFRVFGKLRIGVNRLQAETEQQTLASHGREPPGSGAVTLVVPFTRGFLEPEAVPLLWLMVASLVLVMLVAAANVSNLILASTAARVRELAIRSALGASRRRLIFQLLTESLLLSAAAAVLATTASAILLGELAARVPRLPFWFNLGPDVPTLVFVIALGIMATACAGLGPALRATRANPAESLGTAGSATLSFGRWSRWLMVAEVALSVGLLGGAAVLGRGVMNFGRTDYGIRPSEALVAQVYLGRPGEADPGQFLRECEERRRAIENRLLSLLGARSVGSGDYFPGNDELRPRALEIEGEDGGVVRVRSRTVATDSDYFSLLGSGPVLGRIFDPVEQAGGHAVVANSSFARRHLGNENPLGRRIRRVETGDDGSEIVGPWLVVVGVVPDLGLSLGDPAGEDGIYVPLGPRNFFRVGVRVEGNARQLAPTVLDAILQLDPRAQVHSVTTMGDQIAMSQVLNRAVALVTLLSGGVGLLLGLASLFALTSFAVTQRTREIGLRTALGANRGQVLRAIFARELTPMAAGVLLGLLLGFLVSKLALMMPVPVQQGDPLLLGGVAVLALLTAVVACVKPASRALRVQPAEALRQP